MRRCNWADCGVGCDSHGGDNGALSRAVFYGGCAGGDGYLLGGIDSGSGQGHGAVLSESKTGECGGSHGVEGLHSDSKDSDIMEIKERNVKYQETGFTKVQMYKE